ncbi:ferric reductase-like transmembrane domain-containing protein [Anoxybacillus eryuanensis]|uniref:ferric reductase-like transmembrane domain-containing protein n=1 Tax=Anoxybacillus eryuanensis TaxID=651866 RepID=UPI003EF98D8C
MTIFSTWEWIRGAGLAAYFLLFLSVCFGFVQQMNIVSKRVRFIILLAHQTFGWFAFLIAFFHGLLLHFDSYEPFSWREIFIPFIASYRPFATSLGIVSLYFMFLIFVTTDLMKKVGRAVWKVVHLLILPGFLFAAIHGILIGTDTNERWVTIMYTATLCCFFIILSFRLLHAVNNRHRG